MSGTIDRNLPITITLPAEQWQQMMQAMTLAPYHVAAPLIATLERHILMHAHRPSFMQMRSNGESVEDNPNV